MPQILTRRQLGRVTLARQLLLRRHSADPLAAIERVAGLNAQLVPTAYLSLAARLQRFEPVELIQLLQTNHVARANLMRGTIHILSIADYLAWQPALKPALERTFRAFNAGKWRDIDDTAVRSAIRKLLATETPTRTGMTEHLRELGGDAAMFYARVVLPLVQIPPAGEWSSAAPPRYAWAEDWFDKQLHMDLESLILRYLAAFGPATVKDIQYWSGMTGLTPYVTRLADRLRTFTGEDGSLLYDVPDAPLPPETAVAPPRLLPEFDNLVFAHADRTRVVPPEYRKLLNPKGGQFRAPILLDGVAAGTWRWDRTGNTLVLSPFEKVPEHERAALGAEATQLAEFISPERSHIHFTSEE